MWTTSSRPPCGYPAWAGIDRGMASEILAARRLPRVGGDRPYYYIPFNPNATVTPRGRG